MRFSALTENLATVRGELKLTQEKLVDFEKLKSEKAGLFIEFILNHHFLLTLVLFQLDLEKRLVANQDERHAILERSLTSEHRNEKLLLENGQLAKKNSDLESALQEIAREYQSLQVRMK